MRIITKYIGTTIISYILLVMLLLFGLQAFIGFMREFPNIGQGYYNLLQALSYVLLMLPSDIYMFFPMAGLLGCIIALGLLASHSELIVMRAAGLSVVDIIFTVAKTASVLIVAMLIFGEVFAPEAQRAAIKNKAAAISKGQTLLTHQGVWIRDKNSFIHISYISNDKQLRKLTRYDFDNNKKLKTASRAKIGKHQDGKWIIEDIVQTSFLYNKTAVTKLDQQEWNLTLNPRLVGIAHVDPDQKNLPQLYSYIKHRRHTGLNVDNYEFSFWQRVFTPFATLIMILLAVPFVFGPLRSTTMGLRMLVGVVVGFGFHILNQFVGSMSVVYQVSPILAATLPTIIFAAAGAILVFLFSPKHKQQKLVIP